MTSLAHEFHAWCVARAKRLADAIEGATSHAPDAEHLSITAAVATAEVNFYVIDEGMPEVVEMRILPTADPDNPSFFLHFEMDDLAHAKELFDEMGKALQGLATAHTTRVLLTCTSAMTTTFFANKLADAASSLGLDFTFEARPIELALQVAGDYDAVMLAPQVHARRAEMVARHPDLVVFELPGAIFGSYDITGALRMLFMALEENALAARLEGTGARIVRDLSNEKLILVVSGVFGARSSLYEWRIYDRGEMACDGRIERGPRAFSRTSEVLADLEDTIASVLVRGYRLEDFDAVGLALPGAFDQGEFFGPVADDSDYDLTGLVAEARDAGILLLVDNNANAASVGCYVGQDRYESLVLHRRALGYIEGGQGVVVNGQLVRGYRGMAGELRYLANWIGVNAEGDVDPWTSAGVRKLIAGYLMCAIAGTAPEAIYVSSDLLPDMDEISAELRRWLPEGTVPHLERVENYHDHVLVGEYALCVNALRQAGA